MCSSPITISSSWRPTRSGCPQRVVLGHDLAVFDDPPQLVHHGAVDVGLLADHRVVLVVAVVGIPELAVWSELKLQKLVSKFSLVANIITEIKIVRHGSILVCVSLYRSESS